MAVARLRIWRLGVRVPRGAPGLRRSNGMCHAVRTLLRSSLVRFGRVWLDFPPEGLCWRIHTGDSAGWSLVSWEAQLPPRGLPVSQASTRIRLRASAVRSEEHTSELQSQSNL